LLKHHYDYITKKITSIFPIVEISDLAILICSLETLSDKTSEDLPVDIQVKKGYEGS